VEEKERSRRLSDEFEMELSRIHARRVSSMVPVGEGEGLVLLSLLRTHRVFRASQAQAEELQWVPPVSSLCELERKRRLANKQAQSMALANGKLVASMVKRHFQPEDHQASISYEAEDVPLTMKHVLPAPEFHAHVSSVPVPVPHIASVSYISAPISAPALTSVSVPKQDSAVTESVAVVEQTSVTTTETASVEQTTPAPTFASLLPTYYAPYVPPAGAQIGQVSYLPSSYTPAAPMYAAPVQTAIPAAVQSTVQTTVQQTSAQTTTQVPAHAPVASAPVVVQPAQDKHKHVHALKLKAKRMLSGRPAM